VPSDDVALAVWGLATAGLCALGPTVIRRLPEPRLEDDAADKIPYAELGSRPHLALRLGVAGLAVGAVVGWQLGFEPIAWTWVYLGALGVVLAYVDSHTRLLPTRMIAPSYGVLVVLLVAGALADGGNRDALIRSALGWAIMGGFYVLMFIIYPAGLGYGDVRLSGLLGLALGYVGWGALLTGMYAGFLLGGVGGGVLALLRIADRKRYPFGPFMLLGALVGMIWGDSLADWYTRF
jgi:leader peptidase (prepilin peptidase)/N-methyltransferase